MNYGYQDLATRKETSKQKIELEEPSSQSLDNRGNILKCIGCKNTVHTSCLGMPYVENTCIWIEWTLGLL